MRCRGVQPGRCGEALFRPGRLWLCCKTRKVIVTDQRILYLDFDGVLHADEVFQDAKGRVYLRGPGQLLEHVPVLIDILAPYPSLRIVLSTSWVRAKGYSWVRRRLPAGLRERVIGSTWHSRFGRDSMELEWWQEASRYHQILRDVLRRDPARWIALDDDLEGWPETERARVVPCDPLQGLASIDTQANLAKRLEDMP